jgi:hypothetical protein
MYIPTEILLYIRRFCDVETKMSLSKAFNISGKLSLSNYQIINNIRKPNIGTKSANICLQISENKFYNLWKRPGLNDTIFVVDCTQNKHNIEQHMSFNYSISFVDNTVTWIQLIQE